LSSTTAKNHLISQLKHRFVSHKSNHTKRNEKNHEKNRGFLLIDEVDSDLVLIPNDHIDSQHTRHAVPCDYDDDIVDINQLHIESTTPVTPHLLPPPQLSLVPVINHSHHESDAQATQAGVECVTPSYVETNVHDAQLTATNSNSSSSTNSSNIESHFNNIDRSILNDNDYIVEQKRDFERITVYEIALNDDRRDYQQDLPQNEHDELDFNFRYEDVRQKNLKLKDELKKNYKKKILEFIHHGHVKFVHLSMNPI